MAVGCAIADQCLSTLCLQYEVRKFPANYLCGICDLDRSDCMRPMLDFRRAKWLTR